MPAACRQRGRWLEIFHIKQQIRLQLKKYIKPGQNAQERKALQEKKKEQTKLILTMCCGVLWLR